MVDLQIGNTLGMKEPLVLTHLRRYQLMQNRCRALLHLLLQLKQQVRRLRRSRHRQ